MVVGEVAAEQGEAAVLGDRFAFGEADLGKLAGGDMPGGHSPGQETAGALFLGNGGGRVPGVDIGLGEVRGLAAERVGPGKEVLGLDEPLLGVLAGAEPERCNGGPGAHAGQLVPEAELAQQPFVRVAVQAFEAAVDPAFIAGELPVGGRQGAAADQVVAQVDGRVPVGAGGGRLVGEREAAGDEVGEQAADVGPGEPACGRRGVGGGGQGVGERPQGGGDRGAEDGGDGLGDGARGGRAGQRPGCLRSRSAGR